MKGNQSQSEKRQGDTSFIRQQYSEQGFKGETAAQTVKCSNNHNISII